MLNRRQCLIGAAALGAALPFGAALAAEGAAEISLVEERGRFLIEVGVNAGRGYRFVLDTGASSHFISMGLAEQLRLPQVDSRNVRDRHGRAAQAVVEVDRLDIGGMSVSDTQAIAWSDEALEGHDGLVGYPILGARSVIDLTGGRLGLGAPPPGGSVRIPAEVSVSQTLLLGGVPGAEGRFVFDTGSQRCIVSPRYFERLRETQAYRAGLRLVEVGADGRERSVGFRPPALRFGDIVIQSPAMYVADPGVSAEMFHGVDALFGTNFIRGYVWTVDKTQGVLHAAPRRA